MAERNKDVNGFWSGFAKLLAERGIDHEHLRFYVEWARKFAVHNKGSLLVS